MMVQMVYIFLHQIKKVMIELNVKTVWLYFVTNDGNITLLLTATGGQGGQFYGGNGGGVYSCNFLQGM